MDPFDFNGVLSNLGNGFDWFVPEGALADADEPGLIRDVHGERAATALA